MDYWQGNCILAKSINCLLLPALSVKYSLKETIRQVDISESKSEGGSRYFFHFSMIIFHVPSLIGTVIHKTLDNEKYVGKVINSCLIKNS